MFPLYGRTKPASDIVAAGSIAYHAMAAFLWGLWGKQLRCRRKATELAALQVARLTKPGLHAVGGVAGLHLQVDKGARSWILRVTIGDRRPDMGLVGYPDVTLAGAREAARQARRKINEGIGPIAEARAARSALKAAAAFQAFD